MGVCRFYREWVPFPLLGCQVILYCSLDTVNVIFDRFWVLLQSLWILIFLFYLALNYVKTQTVSSSSHLHWAVIIISIWFLKLLLWCWSVYTWLRVSQMMGSFFYFLPCGISLPAQVAGCVYLNSSLLAPDRKGNFSCLQSTSAGQPWDRGAAKQEIHQRPNLSASFDFSSQSILLTIQNPQEVAFSPLPFWN